MIVNLPFNIKGVKAITLWPFIFIEKKEEGNQSLINHEKIHIAQAAELWVVGFYFLYLFEYLKNRLDGLSHDNAYKEVSFEKEAYANDGYKYYLNEREKFAYKQYK